MSETQAAPEIWTPKTTQRLDETKRRRAAINIVGVSGSGKSHCAVRQFALDPEYGPSEVLVAMVEDSTITYGVKGIGVETVRTVQEARDLIALLKRAHEAGKRLPRIFVLDDLSSLSQNERRRYERDPITTDKKDRDGNVIETVPDTRAMFKKKGYEMIDLLMDIRSDLPMDSFTLVRSTEGGYMKANQKTGELEMIKTAPELALEGYIVPKNLTGHSSITLYLRKEEVTPDPEAFFAAYKKGELFQAHRFLALSEEDVKSLMPRWEADPTTKVDTTIVSRFVYSQGQGEFQGKGHWALRFREKAYMPDILRRIHGEKPIYL